jgi:hypothetical protein
MKPAGGPSGVTNLAAPAPSPDEIRAHVGRVLTSTVFRSSKRCHRFLDFIVTQVLEGKASIIKERTLATEVFDRSASWDSGGDDTIVRVGAREVRKRLAQYYNGPEGIQEKIRVELPLGSYVPEFVRLDTPVSAPLIRAELVEMRNEPKRRWFSPVLSGVLATALLVAALLRFGPALLHNQAFDTFWAPFLLASDPVLVAVSAPLVYTPSFHAWSLNSQRFGAPTSAVTKPLQLLPRELNGADFVPVSDQFLAFGDALAATNVQLLLARHSKEARLRLATKVEFADFRDAPAVVLGAFTNRWTIELTQHLRFHFGYDPHWIPAILDASDPKRAWNIPQKKEDGSSPEDYFLICRLVNSPSGAPMLIGAGVAQFGTEAAGRFLINDARMNEILRSVGKDWSNRNLELVLHAKVIGNSPAAPELVSSYVW